MGHKKNEESSPKDKEHPDVYENIFEDKKCPPCKLGVTPAQILKKCNGCDNQQLGLLKKCVQRSWFHCDICVPSSETKDRVERHTK